ncbi:MAG: hypothetical protein M0R06_07660 [Sphaerochaeta sp.]|jgi:hypothetical protein|nr:hypothetical protein [Sphaerochaeta sp.]
MKNEAPFAICQGKTIHPAGDGFTVGAKMDVYDKEEPLKIIAVFVRNFH